MSATQTTIQAYAHVSGTCTEMVGHALLHRTRKGLRSSDSDIADLTGFTESFVSARRNDLFKMPLYSDGFHWIPFLFQRTRYNPETRRSVQVWAMRIYRSGGNALDALEETNFHLNTNFEAL